MSNFLAILLVLCIYSRLSEGGALDQCGYRIVGTIPLKCYGHFNWTDISVPPCWNGSYYNPDITITRDCRPSCMPTLCVDCPWDTLSPCVNRMPTLDQKLCPDCIIAPISPCFEKPCSDPSLIPTCVAGEIPKRNTTTCCLSCLYRVPVCSATKLATCINTILPSLPSCTSNSSFIDRENCCLAQDSCKCPPITSPKTCGSQDFLNCLRNSPVCDPDELPCILPQRCCPTCRKSSWLERPEVVAKCLANRPFCGDDEQPTMLPGETCHSCIIPRPHCNASCTSNQVCVFEWNLREERFKRPLVSKCVSKVQYTLRILAAASAILDTIKSLTKEGINQLINSWIDRVCDKPQFQNDCHQFLPNLRNIIIESYNATTNEVVITIPKEKFQTYTSDDELPMKRALLQNTPETIVSAATSTDVTGGVDVTVSGSTTTPTPTPTTTSTTTPTPTTGSGNSLVLSSFVVGLAVAILLVFP